MILEESTDHMCLVINIEIEELFRHINLITVKNDLMDLLFRNRYLSFLTSHYSSLRKLPKTDRLANSKRIEKMFEFERYLWRL